MTVAGPLTSGIDFRELTAASAPSVVRGEVADELAQLRRDMLRYRELLKSLPYATRASCPGCGDHVPAQFEWADAGRTQLVLRFECGECGDNVQVHHDTVWSVGQTDRVGSAVHTRDGHAIRPNARELPRSVQTLCPECSAIIVGRYFVADGAVLMEKSCPEHGYFRDIINRNVQLYLKAAYWTFEEQCGLSNPSSHGQTECPADCGLCGRHQSCSCLANLDLTNRCNLDCPICFANANAAGRVYEPSFDEVAAMLKALRDIRPTPATAVQFTGGEPTLHERFCDIVALASEMGFSNIQIATNGLKMADYEFARRSRDAGLHTLYLQFDGIGPEVHLRTRGRDIWQQKLKAIENCRRLDMKVCLVPTIVKTINDDQVGPIFRFAVDNIDVVSAISYQPVCFSGRIDESDRLRQRYTLGDLAQDIAAASGALVERDFYPLSVVMPLAQLLESLTGQTKVKPSCHSDCAIGTYFLVSPDKQVHAFPEVLDVEAMFSQMNRLARQVTTRGGIMGLADRLRVLGMFKSVFRKDRMPPGLDVKRLVQTLEGMVDKNKGRGSKGAGNYRTLMAAGMHFQDRYNYDVERVKRCVIPYSTGAGLIPFCAYNSGPAYRSIVEKVFAK